MGSTIARRQGSRRSQAARRRREAGASNDQEQAAVFAVDTVECLGGSLPTAQRRLVEAWAEIHRAELQHDWDLLQSGQPPVKIAPGCWSQGFGRTVGVASAQEKPTLKQDHVTVNGISDIGDSLAWGGFAHLGIA